MWVANWVSLPSLANLNPPSCHVFKWTGVSGDHNRETLQLETARISYWEACEIETWPNQKSFLSKWLRFCHISTIAAHSGRHHRHSNKNECLTAKSRTAAPEGCSGLIHPTAPFRKSKLSRPWVKVKVLVYYPKGRGISPWPTVVSSSTVRLKSPHFSVTREDDAPQAATGRKSLLAYNN